MSLEASKFRLGLFFSIGSIVFVVAMVWLTGWFKTEKTLTYACYFSESVQGLENGSSVRYNGVPVGEVKSIEVAADGRLIEVIVEIEEGFPIPEESDLAARLDLIGITGIKVINLRRIAPGDEVVNNPPFESRYRTIPVVKSSMETLEIGLERLVEIMTEIDAKQMSDQAIELMANLNRILDNDSIHVLISTLNIAASRIDTLAMVYTDVGRDLDLIVQRTGRDLPGLTGDLHTIATEVSDLMNVLNPLIDGLDEVLSESNLMTSQLRLLLERMRDNPADLLLSDPEGDRWP